VDGDRAQRSIEILPLARRREPELRAYLELMRPANVLTACADVLAGSAIAGGPSASIANLLPATACLYAGGVVFNDLFDRDLDAIERSERPLPSRRASLRGAVLLGSSLLLAGVALGALASAQSGIIAFAIACAALFYDRFGKHLGPAGPLNMALCRALNLCLGMTAAAGALESRWYVALIPAVYIVAITTMSAGEVHGGSRGAVVWSGIAIITLLPALPLLSAWMSPASALWSIPFVALLAWRVVPSLWNAYARPEAARIRAAVRAGVLSLIVLDSAIAAAFGGPLYGVSVLALAPLAAALARKFAVT
jgi:4-hydroxybenzoate polyprenyltransferase